METDTPDDPEESSTTTTTCTSQPQEPVAPARFEFVDGGYHQSVRSHVMRESWRQRKREAPAKAARSSKPRTRPLVPKTTRITGRHSRQDIDSGLPSESSRLAADESEADQGILTIPRSQRRRGGQIRTGIPSQASSGLRHALSNAQTDPFEVTPVKLSSQDQALLHHWITTYAAMMFKQARDESLNPMRDVWMPADMSNAASFHGMLAHSASHIAWLRGERESSQALSHKGEAIRLVNQWLSDPSTSLQDYTFFGVLRLLTYERYWGTEDIWRVHRNGFAEMIKRRGGPDSFKDNWRLELLVNLRVSLMGKPSWFYSSNKVSEISARIKKHIAEHEENPKPGSINYEMLHSLWFLSFVQDLRTLIHESTRFAFKGLYCFPIIGEAIQLIQVSILHNNNNQPLSPKPSIEETNCLTGLLYIAVVLKDSNPSSAKEIMMDPDFVDMSDVDELDRLNTLLGQCEPLWATSLQNLVDVLLQDGQGLLNNPARVHYIKNLMEVVNSLSWDARRGVERCLLHILGAEMMGENGTEQQMWTVDSLLTEMRGR